MTEQLWVLLSNNFGFDFCVKRIYGNEGSKINYAPTLEIKLKRVPVFIVHADKLKSDAYS